jgi:hypothetical protein
MFDPLKLKKMGKMYLGILGGFSGTVGTVVGSTNKKGDDIIRARTKKARTSNTEGQVNQRTKFGMVTGFLQPLNFLLKNGLKGVAGDSMTAYNYACQYALKNAVVGEAPDFELDYNKVLISQGSLAREAMAKAQAIDNKISFSWDDISENGLCNPKDKAVMVVYNVDNAEISYSDGSVTRGSKTGTLALPFAEPGDKLLFYLYFRSENDPTIVSTSQYLGSVAAS